MVKVFPSFVNRHRPRTDAWDSWGGGEKRERLAINAARKRREDAE